MPIAELLHYSHDLIACLDRQAFVLEVNRTFLEKLGYEPYEILGRPLAEFVTDTGRETFQSCWESACRGVPVEGCEIALRCRDGGHLDVQGRLVDVAAKGNRAVYVLFFPHRPALPFSRALPELPRQPRREGGSGGGEVHRRLLRTLLTHEERQLQGVAHAIHDGFVQYAVGAQMWLQAAEEALPEDQAELSLAVFTARESIAQSIREARRMIRDFRPVVVEEQGIAAGIRSLIADLGDSETDIRLTCELSTDRLGSVVESQVFRICQRALKHLIRHGKAPHATVRLEQEHGFIVLEVADEGSGFKPDAVPPDQLSWEDIRVRTEALGGELVIENRPHDGTRVRVRLPLDADT